VRTFAEENSAAMKTDRNRRSQDTDRRETPSTPAPRTAWTRPDFTEVLACAEIGAYAFRAD
jgi:hypothetical protein